MLNRVEQQIFNKVHNSEFEIINKLSLDLRN